MTTPRRRIIRPANNQQRHFQQLQRLRARLQHERAAHARWQKRLRRAFHAVERLHAKIGRMERQLTRLNA